MVFRHVELGSAEGLTDLLWYVEKHLFKPKILASTSDWKTDCVFYGTVAVISPWSVDLGP